jgi:hypothetical protein
MAERWYLVPAEFPLRQADGGEADLEPTMLLVSPNALRAWPEARTLPRRVHGRARKA